MFYLFFYLVVSYSIVGALLFTVKAVMELFPHAPRRLVFRYLTIIGMLLPFTPYAVVATQTSLYRAEMEPAVRRALADGIGGADDPIRIMRVLKISPSYAEVYIVQPYARIGGIWTDEAVGLVIRFGKTPNGWQYQEYDCVWSDGGSADGNTFPPYLEAKEF
ncbi:MAG: hypothetical protein V4671_16955 [Armatimonadota bacterium]